MIKEWVPTFYILEVKIAIHCQYSIIFLPWELLPGVVAVVEIVVAVVEIGVVVSKETQWYMSIKWEGIVLCL